MNPRDAAMYGFGELLAELGDLPPARAAIAIGGGLELALVRMFTAPSGPITASSAVGHA